jgi:hypothetical protein
MREAATGREAIAFGRKLLSEYSRFGSTLLKTVGFSVRLNSGTTATEDACIVTT